MPSWIESLKKWNEGKSTWCIPRKGSEGYVEVRALMNPVAAPVAAPKKVAPVESKVATKSADEEFAEAQWKKLSPARRVTYYTQLKKARIPPPPYVKRGYEAWLKKTTMA